MSDIFNEYAKVAIEKGLIKEADVTKQHNPRFDSLDLEAIEMLYHVKPNGDEKHIMEKAHPNPIVVADSYDKVNGLVENNLERQNIMHQIVTKPNHGKHIHEKYAQTKKELVNEVVKLAYLLDKDGQKDLMSFADDCAERLVKKAAAPVFLAAYPTLQALVLSAGTFALRSLPYVIGAISGVNHFGNLVDQGALKNADRAIEAIDAITDDLPQLNSKIAELTSSIEEFKAVNKELAQKTIELNDVDKRKIESSKELLKKYEKAVKELSREIKKFIALTEATPEADSSVGSTLRDWGLGGLYDFGKDSVEFLFTANDVKQAVQALKTLDKSIHKSLQNLKKVITESKQEAERLAKEHEQSKDLGV